MDVTQVKPKKQIVPMIYAYTTPEIKRHNGWTKIGYTEQDIDKRINQQTHTADIEYKEEWRGNAIFEDGSGQPFIDKDFHRYLRKLNVDNIKNTEWFHINGSESKQYFNDFKSNRGISYSSIVIPYKLRDEQADAVSKTKEYFYTHENAEFLWNAKPRFGKTLSTYDFCKQIFAKKVLIVTNRPAIANSWYSDYEKFLGTESGYYFVSHVDTLKDKPFVIDENEYLQRTMIDDSINKRIDFVSLQDLKGSMYFGGKFDKLKYISETYWDVLVIDEAHEGIDTSKTDIAFKYIKRKFTLHLSGTPFKALANDKFEEKAIFNWTYTDEQQHKRDWIGDIGETNPYGTLPKLNLFTYQMSDVIEHKVSQGTVINDETADYCFDLNLFFETNSKGDFIHEDAVDKFLDSLTTQEKYPFSTEKLRNELKHTFWLLNRVASAKALEKKLKEHPVFKEYKIILAAGDGKTDDHIEFLKSFDKVTKAIKEYDKTITLSVGQLTTGVTIPEWSAVLMLSNMQSPSLYMQAAFRSQNPCLYVDDAKFYRKENAYVFDFDPARTLTIFEEFANDLSAKTASGKGDISERKANIKNLLNFFPVIGEDENGKMIELDAEKVLSIPRKIKSQEVVRHGFMDNYLFQNISNIFNAPKEVLDIIGQFTPVNEPKKEMGITTDTAEELSLDENGNVSIDDNFVIGKYNEIFGDKIYEDEKVIQDEVNNIHVTHEETLPSPSDKLKETLKNETFKSILDTAKKEYGNELKPSSYKKLQKKMSDEANNIIDESYADFSIIKNNLESEKNQKLSECTSTTEKEKINQEYLDKTDELIDNFKDNLSDAIKDYVESAKEEVIKTVETDTREQEKRTFEDEIRDRLRGFSRTIPSFLMAYGNENVTLDNFDKIIPDEVFIEVTSINLDKFRFLRDGGTYIDEVTGEEKIFKGNLFDPVVFNDSVKEFLNKKKSLANYFDENQTEDIFDYIPPQKTNQIFTPKWVVKKMVDMLEEENPECFDDPYKTFIDPYMKSGLYITEIVKRLYNSATMKQFFPDKSERLNHIFANQVYGLAPTEIIYKIAESYILGFSDDINIKKHNLKQIDSLEYALNGTLEEKLSEIYG